MKIRWRWCTALLVVFVLVTCMVPGEAHAVYAGDIAAYAANFIGYPYVWGTHGPNSFDCSGFVYYVYNHFGIPLYTSSSEYWSNPDSIGRVISESEAVPGDIISWDGHVAIYSGNGYCINALNPDYGVCSIRVTSYTNGGGVVNPAHHYIRVNGVDPSSNHDPTGHLDEYTGGVCSVYVRGWAQDSDTPNQSLDIHVYVGGPAGSGASNHVIKADKYRSDLGGYYGFDETIQVNETGTQPIYIYAINKPNGNNPCIGSATVTISPKVTPTAISIKDSLTVQAGKSSTLSVTYSPSDTHSDYQGVTWTSSNENVATVNSSGRVSGVNEGTAIITATSTYNSRLKATCTVTVTKAIPVPEISAVDIDGYNVHIAWNASALIDENDVRTYNVRVQTSYYSNVFSASGITDTFCDVVLSGPGTYRAIVTAVNATTGATSTNATQTFTVGWVITGDWQESSSLPSNVTEETCDIEYKHTYRTTAESSPGSGWSQVSGSGNTTYVNDGAVWETEYQQQTSETLVQVGSYYYHWCGASTGTDAEHHQIGGFTDYHVAGDPGSFNVVYSHADYQDPSLTFYQLTWIGGPWAGGRAWCAAERSDYWYLMYQYQNRRAVTTYTWTKTDDWTDVKDSNAYSIRYRFRLKDTESPLVNSLSVTAVTPRDYTLLCSASDDTGISKIVFYSWTDSESESSAVAQEITVSNSPKSADVNATISISDHGNAKDVYYNTKVLVYDMRGNVTEYKEDSGKVYMPVLMHNNSRKLILPADLLTVEAGAFDSAIGFGEVVLPEGATAIGSRAFAECNRLTLIYMPDSAVAIAADAFADSNNVVFMCASNNAAAAFAREHGIPYFTGE